MMDAWTGEIRGEEIGNCTIIEGDVRDKLGELPASIFQCCVTSPPYWGLRDYKAHGQIGAEDDVDSYVQGLVGVFREVRRVLRDDCTLWLNIGDSYTSGNRTWRDDDKKNAGRGMSYRPPTPVGLKPKDLVGIPWRVAFALQEDGWYLRADIVWNKPNCQPESVKDRPTRSHEYVFLMSKSERYFYDSDAVKVPSNCSAQGKNRRSVWSANGEETVWDLNTEPYKGAHFAVFPRGLVRPCLLAGSSPGSLVLDPFFGSGTTGEVCVELGRRCVGIELKREYIALAKERLARSNVGLGI